MYIKVDALFLNSVLQLQRSLNQWYMYDLKSYIL